MTAEHLGGHQGVTHIDEGTLRWLIERYKITSMLDVGAGPGGMTQVARSMGLTATSLDGDPSVEPDILHDYAEGPYVADPVDLIWCVEFLEHVDEEYLPNYMETFKSAKFVFCTASTDPNGYHHVNCQPLPYWWEKFEEIGFEYLEAESEAIRSSITTMNLDRPYKKQFVKHTGQLYVRT